ncbi:MAG: hypothetical protein V3S21_08660 [Xanthomonadales bacterium]
MQGQEDSRSQFLVQFPNESNLRLQLAVIYQESGDIETSIHLAAEAWTLSPLDVETVCFYRMLLQSKGEAHKAALLQTVENRMKALPFTHDDNDPHGQGLSRALAYEINSLLMKSKSIDVVGYESASGVQSRLGSGEEIIPIADLAATRCDMPGDQNALERYYTARHFVEKRTEGEQSVSELNEAVTLYQGLIEDYPDFSQARSGLAWALMHLVVYDGDNHSGKVNKPRAQTLAREALDICETLGEALVLLPNEADDSENEWIMGAKPAALDGTAAGSYRESPEIHTPSQGGRPHQRGQARGGEKLCLEPVVRALDQESVLCIPV